MKTLIALAVCLIPFQAAALTMQCNHYAAWHNSSLTLEEHETYYSMTSENGTDMLGKSISKRFGMLIEVGFNMKNQADTHTFVHDSISGIPVIIVDSMIFVPTCYQWDAKAPKAEVPASQMWFLSKKRWP
jgi:hypothetical protein